MKMIGNKGNFAALRKMEKIQADVLLLNVDLLRIAEEISATAPMPETEAEQQSHPQKNKRSANPENPVINNVLDYLHGRLQDEDE